MLHALIKAHKEQSAKDIAKKKEVNERLQNRNNILQRNFAEATQESLTNEFETTLESFSDEELEEELEFLKKELKKRKSKKKVFENVSVGTVG